MYEFTTNDIWIALTFAALLVPYVYIITKTIMAAFWKSKKEYLNDLITLNKSLGLNKTRINRREPRNGET